MFPRLRPGLTASILIWLALVAIGLAMRPPLPIDETRYLAVAWEMWRGGDYLVPHLNGAPYHHKPPLLFWLMNLGWIVTGISEIWARLMAPLFSLGAVVLTSHLARLLFPARPLVAEIAPLALIGAAFYALFASLTFFDQMVAFFTVLGLTGVAYAAQGSTRLGWTLFAVAIGLGILSKGPVQILDLAPVPLLAPLWVVTRPASWGRWYRHLALAILAGGAIGLAWAVPAAISGGRDFAYMLFIGQTTERVVEAMWHEEPWWWYVPVAFVLVFPWLWWPAFWRSLAQRSLWRDPGIRFCLAQLVPLFIAFSLISGKQPQYMLPMIPAFALVLGRALDGDTFRDSRAWRFPPVVALLALAVALLAAAFEPPLFARAVREMAGMPRAGMLGIGAALVYVALMAWLALDRPRGALSRTLGLAAATAGAFLVVEIALLPAFRPRIDVTAAAQAVAALQAEGRPVANVNDYHGQYHFAGRLTQPIEPIYEEDAMVWAAAHPGGVIVTYRRADPSTYPAPPLFAGPYRGRNMAMWSAEDLLRFGPSLVADR